MGRVLTLHLEVDAGMESEPTTGVKGTVRACHLVGCSGKSSSWFGERSSPEDPAVRSQSGASTRSDEFRSPLAVHVCSPDAL